MGRGPCLDQCAARREPPGRVGSFDDGVEILATGRAGARGAGEARVHRRPAGQRPTRGVLGEDVPLRAGEGAEVDAERLRRPGDREPIARRERSQRAPDEQLASLVETEVDEVEAPLRPETWAHLDASSERNGSMVPKRSIAAARSA